MEFNTCGMRSQSSARDMASVAFCKASFGSQSLQSGHKPAWVKHVYQETSSQTFSSINQILFTGCNGIDESTDGAPIVPVVREIGDGHIWDLTLDPAHEPAIKAIIITSYYRGLMIFQRIPLFGRGTLPVAAPIVPVPHGHRDGVVEDEGPYQSQNELQLAVRDIGRICSNHHKIISILLP